MGVQRVAAFLGVCVAVCYAKSVYPVKPPAPCEFVTCNEYTKCIVNEDGKPECVLIDTPPPPTTTPEPTTTVNPCGENEQFKTCGSACELCCDTMNEAEALLSSKKCITECVPDVCQCIPGFVRGKDGKCILPEQCPATTVPPTEQPETNKTTCDHTTDTGPETAATTTPPQPPTTVIPCKENEEFLECGSACEVACDTLNATELLGEKECILKCISNICQCASGFVRDKDGKCIRPEQCPATTAPPTEQPEPETTPTTPEPSTTIIPCGENEQYLECGSACELCCDTLNEGYSLLNSKECTLECVPNVCQCIPGFVRGKDGKCIRPEQCPATTAPPTGQPEVNATTATPKPTTVIPCEENEQFRECGSACELCCDTLSEAESLFNSKKCTLECVPNVCQCVAGFVRSKDGKCIRPEQCPATTTVQPVTTTVVPVTDPVPATTTTATQPITTPECKENEDINACGTYCEPTCLTMNDNQTCQSVCVEDVCHCIEGYVRNEDGECILPEQCPATTTVQPVTTTTAVPVTDPVVPVSTTTATVPITTPECDENEEFAECGTSCEPCCHTMNENETCTLECVPNVCQCIYGYVRNEDGKCILPEQCPATTTVQPETTTTVVPATDPVIDTTTTVLPEVTTTPVAPVTDPVPETTTTVVPEVTTTPVAPVTDPVPETTTTVVPEVTTTPVAPVTDPVPETTTTVVPEVTTTPVAPVTDPVPETTTTVVPEVTTTPVAPVTDPVPETTTTVVPEVTTTPVAPVTDPVPETTTTVVPEVTTTPVAPVTDPVPETTTTVVPEVTTTPVAPVTDPVPETTTTVVPEVTTTPVAPVTDPVPETTTTVVPEVTTTPVAPVTDPVPETTTTVVPEVTTTPVAPVTDPVPETTTTVVPEVTTAPVAPVTDPVPETSTTVLPGVTTTTVIPVTEPVPETTNTKHPEITTTTVAPVTEPVPETTTTKQPEITTTTVAPVTDPVPETTTTVLPEITTTTVAPITDPVPATTTQAPKVTTTQQPCEENEEFLECGSECEPCCTTGLTEEVCSTKCVPNVCQCKKGFVRGDDGKCIKPEQCPLTTTVRPTKPTGTNKTTTTVVTVTDPVSVETTTAVPIATLTPNGTVCKENEIYMVCGSECEPCCDYREKDSSCSAECIPKCQCAPGYLRSNGKCVLPTECPATTTEVSQANVTVTGSTPSPLTCDNKLCPEDHHCEELAGGPTCVKNPCCETVKCEAGLHCVMEERTCVKAPCFPEPTCIPDGVSNEPEITSSDSTTPSIQQPNATAIVPLCEGEFETVNPHSTGCQNCFDKLRSFFHANLSCAHEPRVACDCIDGFARNDDHECVPFAECPGVAATPNPICATMKCAQREICEMVEVPCKSNDVCDPQPFCVDLLGGPMMKAPAANKVIKTLCPLNEEEKISIGCESCAARISIELGKPLACSTKPVKKCACAQGFARSPAGHCVPHEECPGWVQP